MKKEYIVFIDSGIGGLTTLSESIKLINRDYIFFADNKHAPYGSHSKKDIYSYIKNIIDNLLQRYHINNIILACNTATTSAIEKLRLTYPNINIIGTEPAVNLANKYGLNSAFCIATPTTIKQQKYFN